MGKEYQKAPDLTVTLLDDSTIRLSEFWQERPLVLVFLRHFG
jgi:peroxiredoxin